MKFGNRKERITGKLALANSIKDSDVATGAAIAYSKLALANSIKDSDVATGAAIAGSKISPDVTNAVIGAASGYKIARGSVSVTGSTRLSLL